MVTSLPLPKSRLESLTDGIFAVTMTLLVLDLKFPTHVFDLEASAWSAMKLGGTRIWLSCSCMLSRA